MSLRPTLRSRRRQCCIVFMAADPSRFRKNSLRMVHRLVKARRADVLKTCRKLGLSFFTYLGDRLGLNGDQPGTPTCRSCQEVTLGLPPPNLPRLPGSGLCEQNIYSSATGPAFGAAALPSR